MLKDTGSPPPMRGKVGGALKNPLAGRITPAYAGKSLIQPHNGVLTGDPPRLCGEKADYFGVTTDYLGSPPPMRGKGCSSLV